MSYTPKEHATMAAAGTALGIATGMTKLPAAHLHRVGLAGPANTFANAATKALRHHASIMGAMGAGTTALVGGPTVVAAAAAAAPFVAVASVAALTGYGLFKAYEALAKR